MIAFGASNHGGTRAANLAITCVGVAIIGPMTGLLCPFYQDGGVVKPGHCFKNLENLMVGILAS